MKSLRNFRNLFFIAFLALNVSCQSTFNGVYLPGLHVDGPACDLNAQAFGGGSGTVSDPYKICTRAHLEGIAGGYLDKFFIQKSDIDLGGSRNPWTPIDFGGSGFGGTYDGNYKTISNLYINDFSASADLGLFSHLDDGGVIKNLSLTSVLINSDGDSVGALLGSASGTGLTVQNCHSSGSVSGVDNVGGLIGFATFSIAIVDSSSSAVTTASNSSAGGLIGNLLMSTITNSFATGAVTSPQYAGGLVGFVRDQFGAVTGEITRSYATGNVSDGGIAGSSQLGGLAGGAQQAQIIDSYATGSVTQGVGGTNNVGGLIGTAIASVTILRSYSSGAVSGVAAVGGLVGATAGGSTATNSYWDTDTSGQGASALGTSRTTAQMKDYTNFTGWDFSSIWNGATYGGSAAVYPFLR